MDTTLSTALVALVLFQVKHVLADFVFQTEYMWKNKGTYGHPGGLVHVAVHGALSIPVLLWLGASGSLLAFALLFEVVVHYHVDWSKDRICRGFAITMQSNGFWLLFGLDQALHQASYVILVAWMLSAAV